MLMNTAPLTVMFDGKTVQLFGNVRDHLFDPSRPYSVAIWHEQRIRRESVIKEQR
jgi:hypothetical protein